MSRASFVEGTIASLLHASEYAASAERMAAGRGLLQRVDARIKLPGLLLLVIAVVAAHHLRVIAAVWLAAAGLALVSRISLRRLAGWVWGPVLFFTGTIALPALVLTPGGVLAHAGPVAVTTAGARSAAFLVARAETAATLTALLVLTTAWPAVLKALRVLRCPLVLVTLLGMSYRYIFVVLETARDMMESRRSRTVGRLAAADRRKMAASSVGVLLSKSLQLGGDVHLAMQARGFRGEVYLLDESGARVVDWAWLAGFVGAAAAALWWGR
jgi:cobalt/nickel transport system permease protein